MALTLAVEDLGDGTAALTVAGAAGAGTVSAARFRGRVGALAWVNVWSFSADGSHTVTITPAHYFWQAAVGPTLSPPVYQSVADPGLATAEQVLRQVAERVRLLALPRIDGRVYVRAEPRDLNISYPCVFVTPAGEAEAAGEVLNIRSDWSHPVRVAVVDRKHPDSGDASTLPDFAKWRQMVLRAFDREGLPGISGAPVLQTLVEPKPTIQFFVNQQGEYSLTGTEVVVRAVVRQPRGFGT